MTVIMMLYLVGGSRSRRIPGDTRTQHFGGEKERKKEKNHGSCLLVISCSRLPASVCSPVFRRPRAPPLSPPASYTPKTMACLLSRSCPPPPHPEPCCPTTSFFLFFFVFFSPPSRCQYSLLPAICVQSMPPSAALASVWMNNDVILDQSTSLGSPAFHLHYCVCRLNVCVCVWRTFVC